MGTLWSSSTHHIPESSGSVLVAAKRKMKWGFRIVATLWLDLKKNFFEMCIVSKVYPTQNFEIKMSDVGTSFRADIDRKFEIKTVNLPHSGKPNIPFRITCFFVDFVHRPEF
jgi:hypothetical protein